MRFGRIAALGFTGVALAVAGVDWLDIGTARHPAMVDSRLLARPPVIVAEDAIERVPDRTRLANLLSAVHAPDARSAAMDAVTALADVPGQHWDSALADAALGHAESAVREEAIHALGERGGSIAVHTLQQALQDPSPRIRDAAVRAFAEMGGDEAVLVLGSALSAADASMRVNAMDALGEIGGPDATRYLEQMLGDENGVVREAAAEWLAELSDGRASAVRRQALSNASFAPKPVITVPTRPSSAR
ncbi:MAG: HEAT repeat domain-containing protein [Gammaproteobacteria bacterium]